MNLSRRGFLAGIIAAGVAPVIVRSGLVMPIKPLRGDGVPLFSNSHPGELTLEIIERGISAIRDSSLVKLSPGMIIVPARLQLQAMRLLGPNAKAYPLDKSLWS